MEKQIDISIIIPVYNAEKYIASAIKSILVGTSKYRYEIIIINDNSIDNTIKIVNQLDIPELKIITNNKNKGVSYSRNVGIENAKGKYIAFLDADDTIEPLMYEKMIDEAEKKQLEIVTTNYNEIINGMKYNSKYSYDFEGNEDFVRMYLSDKISMAVWDKIYNLEWINKKNIRFNEEINIGEDVLFILEIFCYNPKMSFLNKNMYNYFQRENSAMHKIKDSMIELALIAEKISPELYKQLNEEYENEFLLFKCIEMTKALHAISRCKENTIKERKDAIQKILNKKYCKYILKSEMSLFIRQEIFILTYVGIYAHIILFPLYDCLKKIKRRKNDKKTIKRDNKRG